MSWWETGVVDAALRLALAFVLVLPLAWNRERSHAAGIRAVPLLSAGVCGVLLLAESAPSGAILRREAFYGVLTGIGFVGSGVLVKTSERVQGMNSAVTLWLTGAIGAGVAHRMSETSAALSLISVITLWAPGPRWKAGSR